MPGSSTSSPTIPSRRVTSSSVTTLRAGGTSSLRRSTIRTSWNIESSGRSAPASRARRPTVRRVDAERRVPAPLPRPSARTLGTLLLLVVGAIIYGRPALAEASVVDSVKALFHMAGIPPATLRLAGEVLKFFIGTQAAPSAVAALEELLAEPRLTPAVHQRLIEPLAYAAAWRSELIGPERLIALATAKHLARQRNALLEHLIERWAFSAPEAFTRALFDRLADAYHSEPSFRYLLYYLVGRPATPPETARAAAALMAGRFPLHETIRA